jgi:hypothetical protein
MHSRLLARAVCALATVITLATCQLSAADAAGVTGAKQAINPAVTAGAQFCAAGSQQKLCGLDLHVAHLSHSTSVVSCSGCGAWGRWTESGSTWSAKATGSPRATARVLLIVTEPGAVGRYRLYRPGGSAAKPALKLAGQGCVAADVTASAMLKAARGKLSKLPKVPCVAPKLKATVYVNGLNELSSSTITHAIVYGTVSKPMWLTIAQTTATGCQADPLAFSAGQRNSPIWYVFHVKGSYEEGIQVKALQATGRYCFYLQSGAQYDKFADGWVTRWAYTDYATGDLLTGPAATALTAAGATTVALSGDAPRTETLESYDELTPCPEFAELAQAVSFGGSTMQVSGQFNETLTTANFAQSGYVCSYLYNSHGITVALSTDQVSVAGTALKDTTDYVETADTTVTPVSDPVGNVGTTAAVITPGESVHVRCIVNGMGLAPYDPVWYELDSAPYGDAFYVPSSDFYNNGQTSGTPSGGKVWDPAVKFCDALGTT